MHRLIKEYVLRYLGGGSAEVPLDALDDAAVVNGVVFKSDSYTVKPLFFGGGDIGRLAVSGTVNDICCLGGRPLALGLGCVFEEGFPLDQFERILKSIHDTCQEAEVTVVTGDTKVMERGALDRFIVNASGIGVRSEELEHNLQVVRRYRRDGAPRWLLDSSIRPGDKILVSGTIGDHGAAILSAREGYGFESQIVSDVAPVNRLVRDALQAGGVVAVKDPTRGGLANLLNEWSDKSRVGFDIREDTIPIKAGVRAAFEFLGIDPLIVGNEGKVVMAVVPEMVEAVLAAVRGNELGRDGSVIGEATASHDVVALETVVGGRRIISPPAGDPVPRIC